jgi:hypothetical protein
VTHAHVARLGTTRVGEIMARHMVGAEALRHACCTKRAVMHQHAPGGRRLLAMLIRELVRAEAQAITHAPREARRIGDAPPVDVLRQIADHALGMRARFERMLVGHGILPGRSRLGATLSTVRYVVDANVDPERSFRTIIVDLRHGLDTAATLRDHARTAELFGVIRWCDDWLVTRRSLVMRAEAQLPWFAVRAHALLYSDAPPIGVPRDPPAHESQDSWDA